MELFGLLIFLALGIPAMRGVRWAYAAFVGLLLLSFPASMGFRLDPRPCELMFDLRLAVQSLSNYAHITLFFFFFLMTAKQLRMSGWQLWGWSFGLTMAMGAALEISQGLSGNHHCKTVDLIPDFIGAILGMIVLVLGRVLASGRRNGANGNMRGNPPLD